LVPAKLANAPQAPLVLSPHLGSPHTFAALPPEQSDYGAARAVVVSVPYDGTTTNRSGTRDGPRANVQASLQKEL
jgi:agmatinase